MNQPSESQTHRLNGDVSNKTRHSGNTDLKTKKKKSIASVQGSPGGGTVVCGRAGGGSEQWEGRLDKHRVLRSIYLRAIKEGSGHNDVWRTGAAVGGSC